MKDKKIKQKNNNQKMNNNTAKTFRGSFNAIHDSQNFVDTDSIHLDIHKGGIGAYYARMIELFYKNMQPIHHINKKVSDSCKEEHYHVFNYANIENVDPNTNIGEIKTTYYTTKE